MCRFNFTRFAGKWVQGVGTSGCVGSIATYHKRSVGQPRPHKWDSIASADFAAGSPSRRQRDGSNVAGAPERYFPFFATIIFGMWRRIYQRGYGEGPHPCSTEAQWRVDARALGPGNSRTRRSLRQSPQYHHVYWIYQRRFLFFYSYRDAAL